MKIVCLIRTSPSSIYFVNRINERHEVSLVVVESPSIRERLIAAIKLEGILGTIKILKNKVLREIKRGKYNGYNKYFNDKWQSICNNICILNVEDINSPIVYERLKKEQPDLILDYGTSIVKDHILETADLALNLHGGLSPYYRGTFCTEWALVNCDPFNIGVTIHKLVGIIDGGGILAQKRITIKPSDTVGSINLQITQLGTELIVRAIDKIESGEQLQFKKQDYSLGYLTLNRQWSRHIRKQVEYIERNNLIGLMLKKPARKQELPIIEL